MRVSVSGWSTTESDIDRSAEAVLAALRTVLAANRQSAVGQSVERRET
jgi:hypothetical protein